MVKADTVLTFNRLLLALSSYCDGYYTAYSNVWSTTRVVTSIWITTHYVEPILNEMCGRAMNYSSLVTLVYLKIKRNNNDELIGANQSVKCQKLSVMHWVIKKLYLQTLSYCIVKWSENENNAELMYSKMPNLSS